MKTVNIILSSLVLFASSAVAQKKVVCYWYTEVPSSQVNPNICTHIIYSFLGVDSNGGLNHLQRSESQAREYIRQLVALKATNPNLKVLAAIGGFDEGMVTAWATLAASAATRSNFASNILAFIQANSLNGIDIDWEYPNMYQGTPADKSNFNLLLQEIKKKIGSSYSLSVAIGAGSWRTELSYDIPTIFATCDFVNLMSYDLHGGWDGKTGIHGALYRSTLDNTPANVDESIKLLLSYGVSKDKLIVGIPAYGNAFKLSDPNRNGVGAPAAGAGSIKYNSICQRVNSGNLKYVWDDSQKTPYAFAGNEWVGYDDVKSVTEKANYIIRNGFGGAMIWDIDSDDYSNMCGFGKYPLISTIYRIIVGGAVQPVSTTSTTKAASVTTSTTKTAGVTTSTTKAAGVTTPTTKLPVTTSTTKTVITTTKASFVCPSSSGLFRHPTDCSKFYNCANKVAYEMNCAAPLYYNVVTSNCDWPANVVCK